MKNKKIKINILLLLFSLIITLVFLELFLRIYYKSGEEIQLIDLTLGASPNVRISEYEKVLYEYIPFSIDVHGDRINSFGFRSPEINISEIENKTVILFLGDSVTQGIDGMKDSYPLVLQRILGDDYVVINTAMFGYNTVQEVATYKHKARMIKPDIVILGIALFDEIRTTKRISNKKVAKIARLNSSVIIQKIITDNEWRNILEDKRMAEDLILSWKYPILALPAPSYRYLIDNGINRFLIRHSYFYRLINRVAIKYIEKKYPDYNKIHYFKIGEIEQEEAIDELIKMTQEDRTNLFFLIIPRLIDFNNYEYSKEIQRLHEILDGRPVQYTDLFEAYSKYNATDLRHSANDHEHHNKLGAKITAMEVCRKLSKFGYINHSCI